MRPNWGEIGTCVEHLHNEENDARGAGPEYLKKWLGVHTVRSLVADLPAWVCFSIAALKSLRPV